MNKRQDIQQKSRLGTLLIHKGFITRQQLDEALTIQSAEGKRLGEVLLQKGWLTEKQLHSALRKQSRYRLVAAFTAMLVGPFQPFMANASSISDDNIDVAEQMINSRSGMQRLSESDLSAITARGVTDTYERMLDIVSTNSGNGSANGGSDANNAFSSDEDTAITTLEGLAASLIPGTNLLDADMEVTGGEYEPGPRTTINADGSLDIQMPTRIRQIAFRNIRVAGTEGHHMGDVVIRDVSFGPGTSVKIQLH